MKYSIFTLPKVTLFIFCSSLVIFYFYSPPAPLNIHSPKFLGKFIEIYFVYIIVFFALFMTLHNLNPRHNVYKEIILSSILISVFASQFMDEWTDSLNKLITSFTPERLNSVIIGDDQSPQIWPFAVIFINSIIMYIRHNVSVKRKKVQKIGLKKLLIDSFSLYGVLIFLLWIQSHFSYIDAFFSYMTSETRFIHEIIAKNENHPDYLKNFNILYVDNKHDMENEILQRYSSEGDNVKQIINANFTSVADIYLGKPNNHHDKLSWNNMQNFEDWVSFLNNTNNNYISSNEIIITKLVYPDRKISKLEMVRQGILYVKKAQFRYGYYYYFTLSDTFQSNKKHYLYIGSFIIINVFMILALGYLYHHHKNKVFKKDVKTNIISEESV